MVTITGENKKINCKILLGFCSREVIDSKKKKDRAYQQNMSQIMSRFNYNLMINVVDLGTDVTGVVRRFNNDKSRFL